MDSKFINCQKTLDFRVSRLEFHLNAYKIYKIISQKKIINCGIKIVYNSDLGKAQKSTHTNFSYCW